jgi:hypothetical protein
VGTEFAIEVTAKHIERSKDYRHTDLCPIGRALRESSMSQEFPKGFRVLHKDDQWLDYSTGEFHPLPNKAKKFIRRFDAGLPVEPCVIEFKSREHA